MIEQKKYRGNSLVYSRKKVYKYNVCNNSKYKSTPYIKDLQLN